MGAPARVGELLQDYAARGVFRAFSDTAAGGRSRCEYRSLWHRDQVFRWQFDAVRQTLRLPCVLPAVPGGSAMYREFRAWLRQRQSAGLPDHRRCDPARLTLKTYNRGGRVALTAHILDGDLEYAVTRLVALVNEIYLDFIAGGPYLDWQIETFDLDPDHPY